MKSFLQMNLILKWSVKTNEWVKWMKFVYGRDRDEVINCIQVSLFSFYLQRFVYSNHEAIVHCHAAINSKKLR